jgi:hypothetical protein
MRGLVKKFIPDGIERSIGDLVDGMLSGNV